MFSATPNLDLDDERDPVRAARAEVEPLVDPVHAGRPEVVVVEARADQDLPDEVSAHDASEPFPTGSPLPRHARPGSLLKRRHS